MESVARGSDGRRLFTAEFKRAQIDRLLKGEITAAELSRELGVARDEVNKRPHYYGVSGKRPEGRSR